MTSGVRVRSSLLPIEALSYLKSAIEKTKSSDLSLSDMLSEADNGDGDIIVFYDDDKVVGCTYVQIFSGIYNVVMMASQKDGTYKQDIVDFYKKDMMDHGVDTLCMLSRPGWDKIIPDLQSFGTLYIYRQ